MQGKRVDRVGHLVQMELGRLVVSHIKDPHLGFVTITHVEMTPDLKTARVFFSVLGNKQNKLDSKQALEKASRFLQSEIANELKLRFTPKLVFIIDESLDQGMEIDRVIRDIKKQEDRD